ncbi:cysteine peptidase family C39 domain-containing protein [Tundrisphaera sp. TA3]|uniref:cysteine peptidase family C39 domain-containing protein n=1 Tax=Tundrisphaera sp. TA3 TaxID=3435775 RepID=UPI003EBB5FF9
MLAARPPIPFEAQADRRGCGAAALAMAYRALGREADQARVWTEIARTTEVGLVAARSFELAAHALALGLDAATVRARDPWTSLRACGEGPGVALLNHRTTPSGRGGHFSVLVSADDDGVVIHDPRVGPGRRLGRREFLALWSPDGRPGEIAGHVLVAIAAPSGPAPDCPSCRAPMPATIACPSCRFAIPARPAYALGCARWGCPGRLWDRLHCPRCDAGAIGDAPWWSS